MTINSDISAASDAYLELVESLRVEFGCHDVGALAGYVFESEKAEFHWEARVRERYLGQHFPFDMGAEDVDEELSRMAILSFAARRWHAGVCLVDGEGCVTELFWLRSFERREDAEEVFAEAQ